MSARVGADVGGTFTDVVVLSPDGTIAFTKVLSTRPDYDRAVVESIGSLLDERMPVREVVHGTTVATNAVLERRGARTALVTTAGFRDVLELRRIRMPHLYDYFWTKPPPLVPRRLRFEISERVAADGTVVKPLLESDARELAGRLIAADVESVAVCLIHAHLYPEHEELLGSILREALKEIPVSLSSEVLREQQEYERTATTVVNAYVRPLMGRYLGALRRGLGRTGTSGPLTIMQSSGGVMAAEDAASRPVYALESGPAAGVVAALALATTLGHENVITFDVGGTTAKASLIEGGRVSLSEEYEVGAALSAGSRLLRGSGELIRIPTIDIAEIGAGGGSIAWLDEAAGLHVGPQSAGAMPGPACYGLGGTEATVTDANVVLGYIPPGPLASGDLIVSRERSTEALAKLGAALNVSTLEAARGVHALANAATMRALRAVSTERGRDPADFAILAYGGSGPIHAAALADELGVSAAIVPPLAGLFSAAGLLFARAEYHDVRFCMTNARQPDLSELRRLDDAMRNHLRQLTRGEPDEWRRVADVRYRGQSWSVQLPLDGDLSQATLMDLVDRFEDEHERLYRTRLEPGSPIDIRALRLVALGPPPERFELPPGVSSHAEGRREADFGPGHGTIEVPVVARSSLSSEPRPGPLLIDEYDTTIVVPPEWSARVDRSTQAVLLEHVAVEPQTTTGRNHADSIQRRILANALETAADELATTIFRTAHSSVVRDAMDFSAALCGPTGETIAQAATIPLQLGSIPNAMKTLFEHYGDRFHPGDIYMVNDPFDGASHVPDVFVAKPSFLDGALIGFAVTVAHHGDLGGRVPGSCACDCREVFEEGLRLPWIRLYADGQPVEDIFAIIRSNVRIPHEMLGDLSSQVAACNVGDLALQSLAQQHGVTRLSSLMRGLLDHSEELMRQTIRGWPDGTVTFTDYMDSDGIDIVPVELTVDLTVSGDELVADFSRSAPMVRGALNCTPSFIAASVYHTIMAASSIDIPRTAGATRPITVVTKPGTVVHVLLPGASSMRGVTGYRVSDVMNGALAQLIPDRVPAAGEGGSTLAFFTGRRADEPWVFSELVVGTWGGRPIADGNDGLANPCASMANIPVEVAETDWPIFIERYGLVPDSGGAGRYRGGLAVERVWRAVAESVVNVRSDRQIHRPYGLKGGAPGGASGTVLHHRDGIDEHMPPMFSAPLLPGDVLEHRMAGGGGWGDPFERDPAAVAEDVIDEKISAVAARDSYAVVLAHDGTVDSDATKALRRSRRASRETRVATAGADGADDGDVEAAPSSR